MLRLLAEILFLTVKAKAAIFVPVIVLDVILVLDRVILPDTSKAIPATSLCAEIV